MTDNFEKKVAVDGPVVNAGELGSSTFSPGQALPAGPLGLGQRWTVARGDIREFRIEVGAFATTDEAVQSWERLRRQHGDLLGNLSIEFVKSGTAAGTRILARVGPFDAFDRATQMCAELEMRRVGCWVVQR